MITAFNRSAATQFTKSLIMHARDFGLYMEASSIDHLCYRVATLEDYERFRNEVLHDLQSEFSGVLLSEAPVNGRPISTFQLRNPIIVENQKIDVLEIPSPKAGRPYATGFEHFEVVTSYSFDELIKLCPKIEFDVSAQHKKVHPEITWNTALGTIKFHHKSLAEIIRLEKMDKKR